MTSQRRLLLACLALASLAGGTALAVAATASQPAASTALGTMYVEPGWTPKDFAFLYARGQFHLFYIRHQYGVPDDSTERDLGHAVWSSSRGWVQLPAVLPVRPEGWDNLHVWAPSILYDDSSSTWFMYYTGVTRVPFEYTWYQRIGVATSQDLLHWTRYDEPVFSGNQATGVFADSSQAAGCQFRDAFVMPDPASGGRHWLMVYAATPAGPTSQLITHVARNARGFTPWESVMPLWNTDYFLGGAQAHYVGYTESPHMFEWGGHWYLFYSSNSSHRINFEYADSPTADSTAWSRQYRLFTVMGQDTLTDHWYASEQLDVGAHRYFAYVNDLVDGIEIREMTWTDAATFQLGTPSVLDVPPGAPAGIDLAPVLAVPATPIARGRVAVEVTLDAAGPARVALHDVAGRRLRTLHAGSLPAGVTRLEWDGRDAAARPLSPGVYFVRLTAASGARVARTVLLR